MLVGGAGEREIDGGDFPGQGGKIDRKGSFGHAFQPGDEPLRVEDRAVPVGMPARGRAKGVGGRSAELIPLP